MSKSAGFRWISAARDAGRDLPRNSAHVLLVIATYADVNGKAYPSIARIAADCGLKPSETSSMVTKAIADLERRNLIRTSYPGNSKTANRHLLLGSQPVPVDDGASGAKVPDDRFAKWRAERDELERRAEGMAPTAPAVGHVPALAVTNCHELPNSTSFVTDEKHNCAVGTSQLPREDYRYSGKLMLDGTVAPVAPAPLNAITGDDITEAA